MTKDETLKMALEALKEAQTNNDGPEHWDRNKNAITAIKEALAQPPMPLQPEQEPVAWMFQHEKTGRMNYVSNDGVNNPTTFIEMNPRYAFVCPLYTATPLQVQPVQDNHWQPIETAPKDESVIIIGMPAKGALRYEGRRVYEGRWHENQQTWTGVDGFLMFTGATHWMPLPQPPATTSPLPVQPERKPLTDEQIKVIHFDLCNTVGSDYKTVARAIEAAHNIKEQP